MKTEPFTVQELINIEVSETIHKPDDTELIDYQISRYETKLKEIEGIKAGLTKDIDFVLSRIGALKNRREGTKPMVELKCPWSSGHTGCGKRVSFNADNVAAKYCFNCGRKVDVVEE